MALQQEILTLCERLEEWRKNFNGDCLGYGLDKYRPDQAFHYPEAYALWGRGYIIQYHLTNDRNLLDKAWRCGVWLQNNQIHGFNNPCWGLPWKWDIWNAEANTAYLVTTVMVGDFFLDLFSVTKDQLCLSYAERIADWIIEENQGQPSKFGFYYYYANHPRLKFFIPNPSAKAAGYFSRLYQITNSYLYKKHANEAIETIIATQLPNGAWDYSERSIVRDTTHNGYIHDGLFDSFIVFKNEVIKESFLKGIEYFQTRLLKKDGSLLKRGSFELGDFHKLNFYELKKEFTRFSFSKGKYTDILWGYAAGVRSFTQASFFNFKYIESAVSIHNYVRRKLLKEDGSFSFSLYDQSSYIRHQAYYYHALSMLLNRCVELGIDE